jgi:hypothetical protein
MSLLPTQLFVSYIHVTIRRPTLVYYTTLIGIRKQISRPKTDAIDLVKRCVKIRCSFLPRLYVLTTQSTIQKPVNVYRLVTENTVEEKIVERAQQKLKLDAMVVQQGRLKESDKLSKEEVMAVSHVMFWFA